MPHFSINTAFIEKYIPESLRKQQEPKRISLFMTFVLRSSHLDRYINEYTKKRQDTIDHAKASIYEKSQFELAKQKQVEVIDPLK